MKPKQATAFHYAKTSDFTNSADAMAISDLRKSAKDTWIKEIAPFTQVPESQWISETAAMLPVVTVLSRLALDFAKALKERKKQEGLMDFNDMEHYALDILVDREDRTSRRRRQPSSLRKRPFPSAGNTRKS